MLRVGGRRQLQTTEKLSIDSLDKPSQVIVIRDIEDRLPAHEILRPLRKLSDSDERSKFRSDSAENDDAEPSQAEVDESIDALRPSSVLLSSSEYSHLARQLADSYTRVQLAGYLNSTLKSSILLYPATIHNTSKEAVKTPERLKQSQWRPGRTPIEQRHTKAIKTIRKKVQIAKSTPKLVKQVLDLAWGLAIETEKQQIGELEIELQPWQLAFLFDVVSAKGKPMYQEAVESSLLLRQTEIHSFRPDNIVRITGAAETARDVAGRLDSRLATVLSLDVDMSCFGSLLGTEGWPAREMQDVFDERDMRDVGGLTQSLIRWSGKSVLSFHGLTDAAVQSARRLMFSFLDLQAVKTRATGRSEMLVVQSHEARLWPVPDVSISSLHARYRRKDPVRFTSVKARTTKAKPSDDGADDQTLLVDDASGAMLRQDKRFELAEQMAKELDLAEVFLDTKSATSDHSSLWQHDPPVSDTWSVQICRLLQDRARMRFRNIRETNHEEQERGQRRPLSQPSTTPLIVQPQVPGLAELLLCFQPREESHAQTLEHAASRESQLRACFVPSPFTKKGLDVFASHPEVQVTYDLRQSNPISGDSELHFSGMKALVEEHTSHVLMPEETCDLRFTRQTIAYNKAGNDTLETHKDLQRFTETLEASMRQHGQHNLAGGPTIQIPMPGWLLGHPQDDNVPAVDYLCERLEHIHSMALIPRQPFTGKHRANMDADVLDMIDTFPSGVFLRYSETATDSVGGRWGELNLMLDQSGVSEEEAALVDTRLLLHRLAETALKIVHLLTRIEEGTLHSNAIRGWKPVVKAELLNQMDT